MSQVVAPTTDTWDYPFSVKSGKAVILNLIGTPSTSTINIRRVASNGTLQPAADADLTSTVGVRMVQGAGSWQVVKTGADSIGLDAEEMNWGRVNQG